MTTLYFYYYLDNRYLQGHKERKQYTKYALCKYYYLHRPPGVDSEVQGVEGVKGTK